jgi:hypothetical protein
MRHPPVESIIRSLLSLSRKTAAILLIGALFGAAGCHSPEHRPEKKKGISLAPQKTAKKKPASDKKKESSSTKYTF